MTDIVEASTDRAALSLATNAGRLAHNNNRIIPAADSPHFNPTIGGVTGSDLQGFDEDGVTDPAGNDFEITIKGGEAFIAGAYVARDTTTTVAADLQNGERTVAVGFEGTAQSGITGDTVVIQPTDQFSGNDEWVSLFTVITGPIILSDDRPLGLSIGEDAKVADATAQAVGDGAEATNNQCAATGHGASASGQRDTATGHGSEASGGAATATGEQTTASGTAATVTGQNSEASGDNSTVTGQNSEASGDYSTVSGSEATAFHDESAAIGAKATTSAANEGVLGVDTNSTGPHNWRVPGTLTAEALLTVPKLSSDPNNPDDGSIWYRTDLDEYRGVEGGTTVSFDTTNA